MSLFSKIYNKVIDKLISLIIKVSKKSYVYLEPQPNEKPLFLMGMFRSGTSLTSQILNSLGINFGKQYRLLKSQGKLKHLNPDGFYEDFLFAQLSHFLFTKLNAAGDNPPTPQAVNNLKLNKINLAEFIHFSYFLNNDDRISKKFQLLSLFFLRIFKVKYLIKKKYAVKIPMLVPFYEFLSNIYPQAEFLIIIRNPDSTIKSSKKLTDKSDIGLYNQYYQHLYNLYNKYPQKTTVFSYDNLLISPEHSVSKISEKYKLRNNKNVYSLINKKYIRNQVQHTLKSEFYDFLNNLAINKSS